MSRCLYAKQRAHRPFPLALTVCVRSDLACALQTHLCLMLDVYNVLRLLLGLVTRANCALSASSADSRSVFRPALRRARCNSYLARCSRPLKFGVLRGKRDMTEQYRDVPNSYLLPMIRCGPLLSSTFHATFRAAPRRRLQYGPCQERD
jgi:hypothetical protein